MGLENGGIDGGFAGKLSQVDTPRRGAAASFKRVVGIATGEHGHRNSRVQPQAALLQRLLRDAADLRLREVVLHANPLSKDGLLSTCTPHATVGEKNQWELEWGIIEGKPTDPFHVLRLQAIPVDTRVIKQLEGYYLALRKSDDEIIPFEVARTDDGLYVLNPVDQTTFTSLVAQLELVPASPTTTRKKDRRKSSRTNRQSSQRAPGIVDVNVKDQRI